MTDLVIIGEGPAGMTAALYAAQANIDTVIIEGAVFGGQMAFTSRIDNYPSIQSVDGATLSENMKNQIDLQGIKSVYATATSIKKTNDGFKVSTTYDDIECKSVIIANGVKRRRLNIPGENEFEGRGVSWCAVCDGMFFRNKDVAVVGGANSAFKEALYLSGVCNKVYLIFRKSEPTADKKEVSAVKNTKNIVMVKDTIVTDISGDKTVSSITVKNTAENKVSDIEVSGVFEAVGLIPDNEKFKNVVQLDEKGYIITDSDLKVCTDGIYCCGDTRQKSLRQIVTACADGAVCAVNVQKYLSKKGSRL